MATSCEQHSKLIIIEKLLSIEEILITILARLPPKSIFRFKCVSKTWNRLLVEPFFLETYYKADRARNSQVVVGYNGERLLALSNINNLGSSPDKHSNMLTLTQKMYNVRRLVPTRIEVCHSYNGLILCKPPTRIEVCHSYNGLILCKPHNSLITIIFYIINPLTRMFVTLPPSPDYGYCLSSSSGLTWEENTHTLVPSYKVVQAYPMEHTREKNNVVIDTYCSKSGKWEQSTLIAKENFKIVSCFSPLVSNGVFHWYTLRREVLVVYDSNRDEKHVQLII